METLRGVDSLRAGVRYDADSCGSGAFDRTVAVISRQVLLPFFAMFHAYTFEPKDLFQFAYTLNRTGAHLLDFLLQDLYENLRLTDSFHWSETCGSSSRGVSLIFGPFRAANFAGPSGGAI